MGFLDVVEAGQEFSENSNIFGENFTYQNTQLVGCFDQVDIEYRFDEFSVRKITALVCVTSKDQWTTAGLVPADRETVTYGGIDYPIQQIAGANSAGEPAYTLTLFRLT